MRRVIDATPSLFGSTSQTSHVSFGPGFIEEHEFGQIEITLRRLPLLASLLHVGPILLTRS